MASSINERVKRHRAAMREAGLRPVQIWVPDTRLPGFSEECRRQSRAAAKADAADPELSDFLDAALDDLVHETEE